MRITSRPDGHASGLTCLLPLCVLLLLMSGWLSRHVAASPVSSTSDSLTVFAPPHLASATPRTTAGVSFASALGPDRWLARDKLHHLTFSFLWTLSAQYVLVDKADWSNRAALPVAAGSSAAVGLSKELYDWRAGPTQQFSTRDLVADALGIALAVGVIAF